MEERNIINTHDTEDSIEKTKDQQFVDDLFDDYYHKKVHIQKQKMIKHRNKVLNLNKRVTMFRAKHQDAIFYTEIAILTILLVMMFNWLISPSTEVKVNKPQSFEEKVIDKYKTE